MDKALELTKLRLGKTPIRLYYYRKIQQRIVFG